MQAALGYLNQLNRENLIDALFAHRRPHGAESTRRIVEGLQHVQQREVPARVPGQLHRHLKGVVGFG